MDMLSIVIGAVCATVATTIKEEYFKHRERSKQAAYLAIRVGAMLDQYVYDCVYVIGDTGARNSVGILEPSYELPSINFDGLDVDWRAIEPKLAYDVIKLANDIGRDSLVLTGLQAVDETTNSEGPLFFLRKRGVAARGLEAVSLSQKLRRTCGLPEHEQDFWDAVEGLDNHMQLSPPSYEFRLVQSTTSA